jgi:gliding motility-associated protein GldE
LEPDPSLQLSGVFIQIIQFFPISPGILAAIFVVIILLICSALISGSEVAYFSLKATDLSLLKDQNSRSGNMVLQHLEKPELLLATILIANNFVNVGIVILFSYISTELVVINQPGVIKFIFEVIFITAIILFFGEIMPKVYAGQHPKKFASKLAYPMLLTTKIFKPLSTVMVKTTNIVNRRFLRNMKNISLDEISHALDLTGDELKEGKDILKGIVTFGNINVEEVMTSRVDVVDLDIESELSKVLSVIVESGYSRIPVFGEGPDDVKGILYVKDLLPHLGENKAFKWQDLIRPAYYVPETKRINDLLQEFKTHKIHMAIVVDEYGGTAGIATLEDILEEIVGEISDEMDEDETNYYLQPDGSYVFEGKTLLKDFFRVTSVDEGLFMKISGEAETLAGLLLEIKGEIPPKHDIIETDRFIFTILSADNRRIKKIKFALKKTQ